MPLKTTTIGSFPKPKSAPIQDWFMGEKSEEERKASKGLLANWSPGAYEKSLQAAGDNVENLFLESIKEVVTDQVSAGIDVPTDGEVRRENYIHYHCRHLKGIDFNQLTKKVARTGNYECLLPTIVNTIEAQDSFLVHDWSLAQNISSQPVKITIPGPMTISDTIANKYYTSNNQLGKDLAKAINVEIKRLVVAGCKYIQVDEPLFARKPKEAIEYGIADEII